jgi:hypothetical protein
VSMTVHNCPPPLPTLPSTIFLFRRWTFENILKVTIYSPYHYFAAHFHLAYIKRDYKLPPHCEWELPFFGIYATYNCASDKKSRRMRWTGYVEWIEGRGVYRVLVGKPEGNGPLGRTRRRWEDNIKMDLQEVRCGV